MRHPLLRLARFLFGARRFGDVEHGADHAHAAVRFLASLVVAANMADLASGERAEFTA
jgi:hypothetical protein